MQDAITILNRLRRPRLLIRAARAGLADYRREVHLRKLLGISAPRRSGPALIKLIEAEADLDAARVVHCASYDVTRHVEILIAIMGEVRIIQTAA